jgi:hypothetical protein
MLDLRLMGSPGEVAEAVRVLRGADERGEVKIREVTRAYPCRGEPDRTRVYVELTIPLHRSG